MDDIGCSAYLKPRIDLDGRGLDATVHLVGEYEEIWERRGSRMLAMRSSNRGPSLFAYSKTRNGTPPAVVPEIASSTLRTKPSPNGGAW
jgi:hypothetical protein